MKTTALAVKSEMFFGCKFTTKVNFARIQIMLSDFELASAPKIANDLKAVSRYITQDSASSLIFMFSLFPPFSLR